MNKPSRGFTIVELLVVIVVIAILASITVVAYTGIQTRARSAQMVAALDAYEKAIRMYMIENEGTVPLTNIDGGGTYYNVCLGDRYLASDGFPANKCIVYPPMPDTSAFDPRPALNDTFRSHIGTLPDIHEHIVSISSGGNTMKVRGMSYTGYINSSGVYAAFITYNIMGDQSCGRATKTVSTAYGPQMTECRLDITP